MNKILATLLITGFAMCAGTASAQPNVGISIGIQQPGVYGRVHIGELPPPALIAQQPVIERPPRVAVRRSPIYLYVPPAYQQNWGRYCGRYDACDQPVYFVRDSWVRERYAHEHPGWDRGHHRERGHDNDDHDDDRGLGHHRH